MKMTQHFKERISQRLLESINWSEVLKRGSIIKKDGNVIKVQSKVRISKKRKKVVECIYDTKTNTLITAFVFRIIDYKRMTKKFNDSKKRRTNSLKGFLLKKSEERKFLVEEEFFEDVVKPTKKYEVCFVFHGITFTKSVDAQNRSQAKYNCYKEVQDMGTFKEFLKTIKFTRISK